MNALPINGSKEAVGRKQPTNDRLIRLALKCELLTACRADPGALILEELGLGHGAARVDIVMVNGNLHGFEVKSDQDTLKRLPAQAKMFSRVLDRMTLVVGHRHFNKASGIVPDWWGIKLAEVGPEGNVYFRDARHPVDNPSPDKLAIARLLWRDEALGLMEEIGAASGFRSKTRSVIYARLIELIQLDALRVKVRQQFRSRINWRSDERRTSCDG